jgi:hypothetical protein
LLCVNVTDVEMSPCGDPLLVGGDQYVPTPALGDRRVSVSQTAVAHGLDLAKALKAKVTIVIATKPWPAALYGTIPTPSLIDLYEKTSAENAAGILPLTAKVPVLLAAPGLAGKPPT